MYTEAEKHDIAMQAAKRMIAFLLIKIFINVLIAQLAKRYWGKK